MDVAIKFLALNREAEAQILILKKKESQTSSKLQTSSSELCTWLKLIVDIVQLRPVLQFQNGGYQTRGNCNYFVIHGISTKFQSLYPRTSSSMTISLVRDVDQRSKLKMAATIPEVRILLHKYKKLVCSMQQITYECLKCSKRDRHIKQPATFIKLFGKFILCYICFNIILCCSRWSERCSKSFVTHMQTTFVHACNLTSNFNTFRLQSIVN